MANWERGKLREPVERVGIPQVRLDRGVDWQDRVLVLDEIAEMRIVLVADQATAFGGLPSRSFRKRLKRNRSPKEQRVDDLRECIGSAPFTAVQNSEHNQALAVEPILNDVSSIQNTDYELAIFRSPLNRASKLRVIGKKLNLVHQLVGYELGQCC